jgi:L-serine/L-threonine ammonia-lyase
MQPIHIETPCIPSQILSTSNGREIYLKLENCQPSASFKLRGIGALCIEAAEKGFKEFISSSGGNAGLAAAYAARVINIPITVFVPKTTPVFIQDRLRLEGAKVIMEGNVWDEAHAAALKEVELKGAFYIPPFDHQTIWHGNSSMVDELKKQVQEPAYIIVAVGGGGLLSGVLEGLHRNGWSQVPVLACETEGTASFAATLKAKELVTLPSITGIATSLGARRVTSNLLSWIERHPMKSHVVTDLSAVNACLSFLTDHRFLVEPACGAALSAVYEYSNSFPERKGPVVVIVCGGAVVNYEKLLEFTRA